jgi:hypothetical protein
MRPSFDPGYFLTVFLVFPFLGGIYGIVLYAAAIVGIVWFLAPKEDGIGIRLVWGVYLVPTGVGIGLILGLIEGLRPDKVTVSLHRVYDWWRRIGGI